MQQVLVVGVKKIQHWFITNFYLLHTQNTLLQWSNLIRIYTITFLISTSKNKPHTSLSNCPNKQSDSDPIPTWLLKERSSVLVSTITNNVNLSLTSGQSRPLIKKVAHTRLPSEGSRSWSRFLAVSLQVTWVINPAVGCHYFPPGLQLPSQPLRGLLPISLLGKQSHDVCEQFA